MNNFAALYSVNGVKEYRSIEGDEKEKLLSDDSGSAVLTITKKVIVKNFLMRI